MDDHRCREASSSDSREGRERRGVLVFVSEVDEKTRLTGRMLLTTMFCDRWLHVAIFLACIGVATAYIVFARPVYRAQAVLMPVSMSEQSGLLSGLQGTGLGGLAGLAGINIGSGDDFRKEAVALLSSRDFTARFIDQENLLPILFADKWDEKSGKWATRKADEVPTIDEGLEFFDRTVRSVTEDRRTGLVLISIEWHDRMRAAEWANALVGRVNSEMRRRTVQDSDRSLEFLRRELTKTDIVGLQQTLYRLIEEELKKITLASVREEYAFRVIDAARVPLKSKPVRPRRILVFLLGLASAILISGTLVSVRVHRPPGAVV